MNKRFLRKMKSRFAYWALCVPVLIVCGLVCGTACGCSSREPAVAAASMTESDGTTGDGAAAGAENDGAQKGTDNELSNATETSNGTGTDDSEPADGIESDDARKNPGETDTADGTDASNDTGAGGSGGPNKAGDVSGGTEAGDGTDDAGALTPSGAPSPLLRPAQSVKGIYVTGPVAGSERMQELISLVETTELNTMVIDIKNDEGNLTYKMTLPPAQDLDAGIRYVRDMPALIKELHEKDIYVIGRIVCFKDPILASARPELALCKPDGTAVVDANGLAWVNPYKEEVWEYLCTIAEQASADGFDEIQFDYVRFPIGTDADEADYDVDMDTYTREMGLNDFFAYTLNRLHEGNIIFGADLFGTVIGSDIDRDRTGQNYLSIARSCDVLSPMIYPSHYAAGTFNLKVPDAHPYETIQNALELSKEVLSGSDAASDPAKTPAQADGTPTHNAAENTAATSSPAKTPAPADAPAQTAVIRPWLQCFNAIWVDGHITYDSTQIAEQIRAVYDTGHTEWILWNASNHYEQVAEALTSLQSETERAKQ